MVPFEGHDVVHGQAEAEYPAGSMIAAKVGHHKRQGGDQPATFLEQVITLMHGFPGKLDLGVL